MSAGALSQAQPSVSLDSLPADLGGERLLEALLASLGAVLDPAACARAAALFGELDWILRLPSATAPGFVYLAATLRGTAIGGGGAILAEAGLRLAGEAAEVAAQADHAPAAGRDTSAGLPAVDLATGEPATIPAALLDPPPGAPPASLGLATGRDRAEARRHALFELVERDAAAAWWQAGGPAHVLDAASAAPAAARLAALRRGGVPRPTLLLDLPALVAVPVVAALSTDPDGAGLAVGLKAAPTAEAAAEGAVTELLQMEIALAIARDRAARGRATAGDRTHLARAAVRIPAPLPPRALPPVPADPATLLMQAGLRPRAADLTPDGPFAVAKLEAPGLVPLPGGPAAAAGAPGAVTPLM
jgi:hypothetical protein